MAIPPLMDDVLAPLAREHITRFIQRIGRNLSAETGNLLEIGLQDRSVIASPQYWNCGGCLNMEDIYLVPRPLTDAVTVPYRIAGASLSMALGFSCEILTSLKLISWKRRVEPYFQSIIMCWQKPTKKSQPAIATCIFGLSIN